MKCKYCGGELKENSKFCPKCGHAVQQEEPPVPVKGLPAGKEKGKSKRKGCLLGAIILLVVILGAATGGFAYYRLVWKADSQKTEKSGDDRWRQGEDGDESTSANEETESTPEETTGLSGQPEESPGLNETAAAVPAETASAGNQGTSEADAPLAANVTDDQSEHWYEIVQKDCTWTEAFEDARSKDGYLVHIDSMEEFDSIRSNLLNTEASRKMKLWIGGVRVAGSNGYHWANVDGTLGTEILNNSDVSSLWMAGEPSFRDESIGQDEYYMNMFYYTKENRWVWNDVPDDIIAVVGSYKGSVGYICEHDR